MEYSFCLAIPNPIVHWCMWKPIQEIDTRELPPSSRASSDWPLSWLGTASFAVRVFLLDQRIKIISCYGTPSDPHDLIGNIFWSRLFRKRQRGVAASWKISPSTLIGRHYHPSGGQRGRRLMKVQGRTSLMKHGNHWWSVCNKDFAVKSFLSLGSVGKIYRLDRLRICGEGARVAPPFL